MNGVLCAQTPNTVILEQWLTLVCNGDGITGDQIKLERTDPDYLTFCGIKAHGVLDPYATILQKERQISNLEATIDALNDDISHQAN